eukprot:4132572-Amphidinium_carterae.1
MSYSGHHGEAPFVLSAFKLACLHYTPSPVPHRGRVQDRVELLDERRDLLELERAVQIFEILMVMSYSLFANVICKKSLYMDQALSELESKASYVPRLVVVDI